MRADQLGLILENLSYRQKEVLKGIFQGQGDLDIAKKLNISEDTVRKHIAELYKKLEIKAPRSLKRQKLRNFLINNHRSLSYFFSSEEDRELLRQISLILSTIDKQQKHSLSKFLEDLKEVETPIKITTLMIIAKQHLSGMAQGTEKLIF